MRKIVRSVLLLSSFTVVLAQKVENEKTPADFCFYLLTDRKLNVNETTSESKVFLIPDYFPTIGRFRLCRDSLVLAGKTTREFIDVMESPEKVVSEIC